MQTRAETHPTDLNEAVRRYQAGDRGAALELCRDLVERQPDDLRARYTFAVMLLESGRLRDGIAELDQLLDRRPDDADALHGRGVAHDRLGETEAAVADLEKAITLAPGKVETPLALAGVHRRTGDVDKAITVLRGAQKASPDHAGLTNNLASLLAETGALEESRELLEALIARDATSTAGHYNLGNTLKAMGEPEAAVRHLRQATALDPGFYSAWHNLGNTLLDLGSVDEAADAYDRATAIKRRPGGPAVPANNFNQTSRTKLEHDIEQLGYLLERGVLGPAHQQTASAYRAALSVLETPEADSHMVDLPAAAAAMLKPTYNRMIHKDVGAALDGPAVNPDLDIAAIEADYKQNAPGITFFDGFLTAEAVQGLRRFCLESTIWYEFRYANGYLGAFMEDGFCCPLLLQVAEEMRTALPAIFQHHTLRKLWAFKYDSRLSGIPMHADFAAVNVNFWITPDEANLDPDGGGLEVWDVEAPLDWDFAAYNRDGPRMRNYLKEHHAKPINVPHRQNRVVMFNSDLFHETGRLTFKPGYENRRVNITMLYGKRGDAG